jgi:mannosyltransferase
MTSSALPHNVIHHQWRPQIRAARFEDASVGLLAGVAMAVCALATLPSINRQPLSWDEAVTLDAAERRLSQLVAMVQHTDAPLGFYYACMHVWIRLGDLAGIGGSAGWMRLPSALAAIAAVGILVTLVAGWFGRRVAIVSGVLLAVHPLLTFYAQDARPYALVTCSFLAATWLLQRAIARPDAVRLAAYAVVATLTIYLHLFAAYAFVTHLFLVGRSRRRLGRWAVVAVAVAAAVAPLVVTARRETGELSWIGPPTASQVGAVLIHLLGGVWLAALLVALAGLGLARSRPWRATTTAVLLWAIVPIAGLVVVDVLVLPDLVARYGLVTIPAAVTLAALAVRRRGPVAAGAVAVAVALAAVTSGVQASRPYKYEDYRAADDTMGDLARPGAGVVFLPESMRVGFEAYRNLEPDIDQVRDLALAPGGAPLQTDLIGGVDQPPSRMAGLIAGTPQIFVLGDSLTSVAGQHLGATAAAELAALRAYRVVRTMRWGVIYLTVLQRRA